MFSYHGVIFTCNRAKKKKINAIYDAYKLKVVSVELFWSLIKFMSIVFRKNCVR